MSENHRPHRRGGGFLAHSVQKSAVQVVAEKFSGHWDQRSRSSVDIVFSGIYGAAAVSTTHLLVLCAPVSVGRGAAGEVNLSAVVLV